MENKTFNIDQFNMELANSIEDLKNTCDEINKDREMKLEDIPHEMERIMRNMEWSKMCSIDRRIDLLNDKMDLILRKLGE